MFGVSNISITGIQPSALGVKKTPAHLNVVGMKPVKLPSLLSSPMTPAPTGAATAHLSAVKVSLGPAWGVAADLQSGKVAEKMSRMSIGGDSAGTLSPMMSLSPMLGARREGGPLAGKYMRNWSEEPQSMQMMRSIFNGADRNRDGHLDEFEIYDFVKNVLMAYGINCSDLNAAMVGQAFRNADGNNRRCLSLEEAMECAIASNDSKESLLSSFGMALSLIGHNAAKGMTDYGVKCQ